VKIKIKEMALCVCLSLLLNVDWLSSLFLFFIHQAPKISLSLFLSLVRVEDSHGLCSLLTDFHSTLLQQ